MMSEPAQVVERSGPLTAAQRRMWQRTYWRGRGELFPGWLRIWDFDESIPVAAATAAFAELCRRHEILRTRFLIGPSSEPVQLVMPAGQFRPPVTVAPLSTYEDYRTLLRPPLLIGRESDRPLWSARLFCEAGLVRSVALVFDHLISDGAGLRNWRSQFLELALGGQPPVPDLQPLDRAASEARPGPSGSTRFRETLQGAPQVLAPRSPEPLDTPRFLVSTARYRGLLPLLDEVVSTTPASRAQVLMFAVGWLISRYSGARAVYVANYLGNREPDDHGIECQSRPVELRLDIDDDASFTDALLATCRATLDSYARDLREGPAPLESGRRIVAERGNGALVPMFFNYQGQTEPPASGGPVPSQPASVAITDAWEREDRPFCLMLYVYVLPDEVVLDFDVDAVMVPAPAVHAMLRLLPELLAWMGSRPDGTVRSADQLLPPDYPRAPACPRVGGSWANLEVLRTILAAAPGVRECSCRAEPSEVIAELTVVPGTEPFDIHEHVLSALHENPDVTAPSEYRFTDQAGRRWRPDSDRPKLPPASQAEHELCAALFETHGLTVEDLACSYVEAGGLLLRSPAVVEALRWRGLTGLSSGHFTSPCSLRSVARALAEQPPVPAVKFAYLP